MVPSRRRQVYARDLQIHSMLEREVATQRHLRVYGEDEDCCGQAARGAETDSRTAETRTEDQRTRTILALEQIHVGEERSNLWESWQLLHDLRMKSNIEAMTGC
jgi:hypothetical protein